MSQCEWGNLPCYLMQDYFGLDIVQSTLACGGAILFLALVLWILGGIRPDWSAGTIFGSGKVPHQDRDYNSLTYEERVEQGRAEQNNIQRGLLMPALGVIAVAFLVALWMLVTR